MNKWVLLIACIALCQAAGIFGSIFTMASIPTWYSTLNKPSFTPPNWLFGPVWVSLFTLMGISLYMVAKKGFEKNKPALTIFGAQLFLNFIWNVLFFGMRSPLYGLIGIVALWLSILLTMLKFYKISKSAGLILIPYIAWVSIATALNYSVFVLNM
jgi:translocator protein